MLVDKLLVDGCMQVDRFMLVDRSMLVGRLEGERNTREREERYLFAKAGCRRRIQGKC